MNQSKSIILMLADDDEDDKFLFKHAVERLDLPVVLATTDNGLDLIQYLTSPTNPTPHMVFMDINMPGMNGLECLTLIRKIQKFKKLPIAIYSTSSEQEYIAEAIKRGANSYIKKPNQVSALKDMLHCFVTDRQRNMLNGHDPKPFFFNFDNG
jgi:CheY-like chemotaxis protein